MRKRNFKIFIFAVAFFASIMLSSCTVLKPYQKVYVNDIDMQLGDANINNFDNNFKTYREGTSGGNGSKSGGGCGCN